MVFIESEEFLHPIDRKIKAKILVPLRTKKKAKVRNLLDVLKMVNCSYNQGDFKLTLVHAIMTSAASRTM